jgi:hypothetical protein
MSTGRAATFRNRHIPGSNTVDDVARFTPWEDIAYDYNNA